MTLLGIIWFYPLYFFPMFYIVSMFGQVSIARHRIGIGSSPFSILVPVSAFTFSSHSRSALLNGVSNILLRMSSCSHA